MEEKLKDPEHASCAGELSSAVRPSFRPTGSMDIELSVMRISQGEVYPSLILSVAFVWTTTISDKHIVG